tara:strand:- start:123 stop:653 length:531 start_codon:yes stop_codon:yes gene_type:complete
MMAMDDVYEPIMPMTEAQDLLNNLLDQVQLTGGRDEYLNLIRKIESDNDRTAVSSSGAKGVYQFKDSEANVDAVKTAKQRALNLGFDKATINLMPNDPTQFTDDEADILMLANMFAQSKVKPGFVDNLLVDAFSGDRKSMQDAYYMLHHTSKTDPGTQSRVESIIPLTGLLEQYDY